MKKKSEALQSNLDSFLNSRKSKTAFEFSTLKTSDNLLRLQRDIFSKHIKVSYLKEDYANLYKFTESLKETPTVDDLVNIVLFLAFMLSQNRSIFDHKYRKPDEKKASFHAAWQEAILKSFVSALIHKIGYDKSIIDRPEWMMYIAGSPAALKECTFKADNRWLQCFSQTTLRLLRLYLPKMSYNGIKGNLTQEGNHTHTILCLEDWKKEWSSLDYRLKDQFLQKQVNDGLSFIISPKSDEVFTQEWVAIGSPIKGDYHYNFHPKGNLTRLVEFLSNLKPAPEVGWMIINSIIPDLNYIVTSQSELEKIETFLDPLYKKEFQDRCNDLKLPFMQKEEKAQKMQEEKGIMSKFRHFLPAAVTHSPFSPKEVFQLKSAP